MEPLHLNVAQRDPALPGRTSRPSPGVYCPQTVWFPDCFCSHSCRGRELAGVSLAGASQRDLQPPGTPQFLRSGDPGDCLGNTGNSGEKRSILGGTGAGDVQQRDLHHQKLWADGEFSFGSGFASCSARWWHKVSEVLPVSLPVQILGQGSAQAPTAAGGGVQGCPDAVPKPPGAFPGREAGLRGRKPPKATKIGAGTAQGSLCPAQHPAPQTRSGA